MGDLPEYAEALVIKDGKIEFWRICCCYEAAGEGHQMINLRKTLLPGFIDGHAHFANFSAQAIGAQILPPEMVAPKTFQPLLKY
jgi:predicted amidohydrolase YtcJ